MDPEETDVVKAFGGERGIRTLEASVEAVSYGFVIARSAVVAVPAVAPCTLLHAGAVNSGVRNLRFTLAL